VFAEMIMAKKKMEVSKNFDFIKKFLLLKEGTEEMFRGREWGLVKNIQVKNVRENKQTVLLPENHRFVTPFVILPIAFTFLFS
jgi:hypothetical protein